MAHYAFLDEYNNVIKVITGRNENEDDIDWENWYSEFEGKPCKRYSYNTYGGIHKLGGIPFRKNAANYGYKYDEVRDAFVPPHPHPSWILNEDTCLWDPPKVKPTIGSYFWDEDTLDWIENGS